MEVYGIIYLLIDAINDKEYIGKTTRSFKARFNQHKKGNQYIDRVIKKRGDDLIVTAILKECENQEELDRWEKHFIRSRDTLAPNGYNLREGGEGGKLCAEAVAKLSVALTGKKKSSEHVAKVALALKGRKQPPEFVAKHAVAIRKPSPYKILQKEIKQRKLTYAGISRVLGLTDNVFSNKMRGRKNFTAEQVAKLVEIFSKPAEYLLARDEGIFNTNNLDV